MATLAVRDFREKAKLSLEQLAHDVGISVSQLSRIERDEREARIGELQRIATRLNRRVGDFIGEPPAVQIPLISWVSAGRLADPQNEVELSDAPMLGFTDMDPGDWFALRVRGDSMDRVSPEGAIILVDRADRTAVTGKCYVFSVRGEVTYKRWRPRPPRLEPFSTNPSQEPIFPELAKLTIIGRVRRTVLDL